MTPTKKKKNRCLKPITDNAIKSMLTNYIQHRNYPGANRETLFNDDFAPINHSSTSDKNLVTTNEYSNEAAGVAINAANNRATLRLSSEDFVREIEGAYKDYLGFASYVREILHENPGAVQEDSTAGGGGNSNGGTNGGTQLNSGSNGGSTSTSVATKSTQSQPSQNNSNSNEIGSKRAKRIGDELVTICFPLYCCIFIQLFECGHVNNARQFYLAHQQRFMSKRTATNNVMIAMQNSLKSQHLSPALVSFKKSKCRAILSEDSFNLLVQFCSNANHLSILQIMNESIDFRVMSASEYASQYEFFEPFNPSTLIASDPPSSASTTSSSSITTSSSINPFTPTTPSSLYNNIKKVIQDVRDLPERLPGLNDMLVCQYEIQSPGVTTVAVASNLSKIAAGNESSEIILWDFDLADSLQYYSSRIVRHWKRIPVRRVISEVDFKFIDFKSIADEGGFEEEEDEDDLDDQLDDKLKPLTLRGHSKAVYEMAFVDGGGAGLLSASADCTIRSWDCNGGACLAVYQGHSQAIWTLDSNDSGCFLSAGREGNAYMWDIERTVPLRIYTGHDSDINRIRFHPNANYLATASSDKTIILWDVNQVRQVRMFLGHAAPVSTIEFSSCGRYLASAAEDGAIRIWDISQGKCVTELMEEVTSDDDDSVGPGGQTEQLQNGIQSIAFGQGDRLLASCGATIPAVNVWKNPVHDKTLSGSFVKLESTNHNSNMLHVQFLRENLVLALSKQRT